MLTVIKKRTLLLVAPILMACAFVVTPLTTVSAATTPESSIANQVCQGVGQGDGTVTCDGSATGTKVNSLIAVIVSVFSWVVGVVAVVMIIFGGFRYVTSSGDSGKVTSARNTITYALVGLVVAVIAQLIVKFVLGSVTKAV